MDFTFLLPLQPCNPEILFKLWLYVVLFLYFWANKQSSRWMVAMYSTSLAVQKAGDYGQSSQGGILKRRHVFVNTS